MIGLQLTPMAHAIRGMRVDDDSHYLPTFDGISQCAKFAETIVGSGQGELRVVCKLSDIGDPYFYICDGDETGLNRPYIFKPHGGNALVAASGLAVTIDKIGSSLIYGQICEILITGDFTGLNLATLFARYNGVECAEIQPFSLGYKDDIGTPQEREFSYNFLLSKPRGYILPDDCFVSRNLVEEQAIAISAGGGVWTNAINDSNYFAADKIGKPVEIICRSKSDVGVYVYVGTIGEEERISLGAGEAVSLAKTLDSQLLRVLIRSSSPQNDGHIEIEVREVSNAIILKNTPADIADMFEQVVQRGDGDYENKKTKTLVAPLSDHLKKHFQIEQIKDSIDTYWAKNKSFYLPHLDGVNDRLALSERYSVGGPFILEWDWMPKAGVNNKAFGCTDDAWTFSWDANGNLYVKDPSGWLALGQVPFNEVRYRMRLERDSDNTIVLSIDRKPTGVTASSSEILHVDYLGFRGSEYFAGHLFRFCAIAPNNPLPIGQGGNSGFWPLDGSTAIAEQKLGLDKKGKIIAKDGAGTERAVASDFLSAGNTALSGNTITMTAVDWGYIAKDVITETGKSYVLKAQADVSQTNSLYQVVVWDKVNAFAELKKADVLVSDGEVSLKFEAASIETRVAISRLPGSVIGDTIEALVLDTELVHGHGEWQGLSANLDEIKPVTRNADGALVGASTPTTVTPTTGGGWNNSVYSDHNTVGNTISLRPVDVTPSPQLGDCIETPYGGLEFVHVDVAKAEFAVNSSYEADLFTWLTTKIGNGETLNIFKKISLSDELQRQHDLTIIEKQMDRQLKKAERSMVLCELDGIDDTPSFPEWLATGDCTIAAWCVPELNRSHILSDSGSDAGSGRIFHEESNNRVALTTETGSVYATGDLVVGEMNLIEFDRESGVFTAKHNGRSLFVSGANNTGSVRFNQAAAPWGKATGVPFFEGRVGAILLLDKANPKNSRFYVHDKEAGVYRDVLHPDGSMDGTYHGMSLALEEIQSFRKKGDDWISSDQLTTVKGA